MFIILYWRGGKLKIYLQHDKLEIHIVDDGNGIPKEKMRINIGK
ncbi:hypothetical protein [Clostridium thailandense]